MILVARTSFLSCKNLPWSTPSFRVLSMICDSNQEPDRRLIIFWGSKKTVYSVRLAGTLNSRVKCQPNWMHPRVRQYIYRDGWPGTAKVLGNRHPQYSPIIGGTLVFLDSSSFFSAHPWDVDEFNFPYNDHALIVPGPFRSPLWDVGVDHPRHGSTTMPYLLWGQHLHDTSWWGTHIPAALLVLLIINLFRTGHLEV